MIPEFSYVGGQEANFQFKKYPKISCSAGILPANNTRTGKMPLDSEALLQAVHLFCGVLLVSNPIRFLVHNNGFTAQLDEVYIEDHEFDCVDC